MEQVSGQIEVAQFALRSDLPTVGLCLGMQTMATAVAREVVGYNDANMEEADPSAQTKTFVRLHDEYGRPEFRLGLRRPRIAEGSRLASILGGATRFDVHCNHRYVLDPQLHTALQRAGLRLCGLQEERDLADAIELPSLRFFVGMQGHPELMTRRGAPHPLILAFLRVVARA
jgi:CTP synthase